MKIVMYTAQAGNYKMPENDNVIMHTGSNLFSNPVIDAKIFKILGHLFYPDADILIWLDANIKPLITPEEIVENYLGQANFAIPVHPYRNCIYDEFTALKFDKRFSDPVLQEKLKQQEEHYRNSGFEENQGLFECNFIIRRNNPAVNMLFNNWWAEICRWQQRDQVSLPFVLFPYLKLINNPLFFWPIQMDNIRENKDFKYQWHY